MPHVGGHEGVGKIVSLGPGCAPDIKVGNLVGIRFASRICRQCEFCLAGKEQYCIAGTNHLQHEDGSFQEYIALNADYLTVLPDDIDPKVIGPVLCAGLTTYNVRIWIGVFCRRVLIYLFNRPLRTRISRLESGLLWLVLEVDSAILQVHNHKPGLENLSLLTKFLNWTVQYAKAQGAKVIGIDGGAGKREFVLRLGAEEFIDFTLTDPVKKVYEITGTGAHAAVVTAGNAKAYAHACEMLRVGGTISCVGIPSGQPFLETPISTIVIKALRITGSLIGSESECQEAVELVRQGIVKPQITVRDFKELPTVYEEMEKGDISGRIVLKVAHD